MVALVLYPIELGWVKVDQNQEEKVKMYVVHKRELATNCKWKYIICM